ncbi:hypothetical protein CRE_23481 [Caenorhabditis remanei]|uniref:Glycoprotein n=1 Tax=Caenorhabditis remanei TaxID=31234 RepID=E3MGY8_CAERE|nr:hypothetical protein CRE_23481 [Caenorhabditis remanei]
MKMQSIFLLILLFPIVLAVLTSDIGYGFVEDDQENRDACDVFDISINFDGAQAFLDHMRSHCAAEGRINKTLGIIKKRSKKEILTAVGFVTSAIAFGVPLYTILVNIPDDQNELKKEEKLLHNITELIQNNSLHTQDIIKAMEGQIQNATYETIVQALFSTGDIQRIAAFFQINLKEIVKKMGFDETVGLEAAHKLSHTFVCGKNPQEFQLQICGSENPTRRFGEVKEVAPVGNFIHGGSIFAFYELPKYVIYTNEGPISATHCEPLGMYFGCRMAKGKCGFVSYRKCPVSQRHTPDGIFVVELGDATVVSSTVDVSLRLSKLLNNSKFQHYSLYVNGSNTTYTDHRFPATGQLLIRAPHSTKVKIGSRVIQGRHDHFELREVHTAENIPHLSHEQLELWVKNNEAIGKAFTELEKEELHNSIGFNWSWDAIKHWIQKLITAFMTVLLILTALFLVGAGIYCYCVCRCQRNLVIPN